MTVARLLALGSFALATGCAPVTWEHQASGSPPTAAEAAECRRSAYMEAQHQASFHSFARQRFYQDGTGRIIYDSWLPFGRYEPFLLEPDLFRFCLEAKGYRLVPARPADSASDGRPGLQASEFPHR